VKGDFSTIETMVVLPKKGLNQKDLNVKGGAEGMEYTYRRPWKKAVLGTERTKEGNGGSYNERKRDTRNAQRGRTARRHLREIVGGLRFNGMMLAHEIKIAEGQTAKIGGRGKSIRPLLRERIPASWTRLYTKTGARRRGSLHLRHLS